MHGKLYRRCVLQFTPLKLMISLTIVLGSDHLCDLDSYIPHRNMYEAQPAFGLLYFIIYISRRKSLSSILDAWEPCPDPGGRLIVSLRNHALDL